VLFSCIELEFYCYRQEKSIILSSVFNGKAIFIKFAASENDYNSHIAEVEKVIDSVKITGA
jgi:hypothetical protein